MNTKIWVEELSFGSNFGNFRVIGFSRIWWYFLVHIFDFIKRFPRYSKVVKNFILFYLHKSSCDRIHFDSRYVPFKEKKTHYLYPFSSFSVHKFCGRPDKHFSKKFSFFLLIKNIYTCLYLPRLFFKFHPHSVQS